VLVPLDCPRLRQIVVNLVSRLLTEGLQRARSIGVGALRAIPAFGCGLHRGPALVNLRGRFSVHLPSNSRRWLRPTFACKRHQMRHLCDLTCLVAKQMLSQLSYTPTRPQQLVGKPSIVSLYLTKTKFPWQYLATLKAHTYYVLA
jgi:hypothetical protein